MRTAKVCPTCSTYTNSLCVVYSGPYLNTLNINNLDSIELALQKINLWASNNSGGGGGGGGGGGTGSAVLTENVTSTLNVGGISQGDTFLMGTSFTDFVKALIAPTIKPTILSYPTISVSGVNTQTLEVGTNYQQQINTTFTRGTIQSKDGSGNVDLVGPLTSTTYTGTGVNSSGFINTTIVAGTNQWGATANFSQGTSPYYDSNGNAATNLDASRVAGNVSGTTNSVIGRYRYWYAIGAIGSTPSNSAGVRGLPTTGFAESTMFNIVIPPGTREIAFYLPSSSNLVGVAYIESSNTDVTSTFVVSAITVQDANGVNVSYNKYTATIGGVGYPSMATYKVTIN